MVIGDGSSNVIRLETTHKECVEPFVTCLKRLISGERLVEIETTPPAAPKENNKRVRPSHKLGDTANTGAHTLRRDSKVAIGICMRRQCSARPKTSRR